VVWSKSQETAHHHQSEFNFSNGEGEQASKTRSTGGGKVVFFSSILICSPSLSFSLSLYIYMNQSIKEIQFINLLTNVNRSKYQSSDLKTFYYLFSSACKLITLFQIQFLVIYWVGGVVMSLLRDWTILKPALLDEPHLKCDFSIANNTAINAKQWFLLVCD
jgi:hypothetical protein